ncbi:ABC transporter permease [Tsukamurella sp. 8F]|uniref:ABC transporter permease n=1 Tax=unclassified Tsukamurella TaxID=2633480 RepID=UPI0023B92102|nr:MULTISPECIES: ABC transporter permease [unclassified Tsukamurella]MDF0531945.1 ABC transporter permease [Tsukamurella sp. 8J]MDF0588004.1 ABC transporter permease [Tsukamurella sp. 8F]
MSGAAVAIGRSLALRIATLLVVVVLTFWLLSMLPGDGVGQLVGRDVSASDAAATAHALGVDRAWPVQCAVWLGRVLRGDFGVSHQGEPIADVVGRRVPATLLLAVGAMALGTVLALAGGLLAHARPGGPVARGVDVLTGLFLAIPEFALGVALTLVFGVWLAWLPTVTVPGPGGGPASASMLVLPMLALALPVAARNVGVVAAALAEADALPGARAARLDGATPTEILTRHLAPAAAPTVAAALAVSFSPLLGGTVVVETLFNYPGLGSVLSGAISDRDAALAATVVLLMAAVMTLALIGADLLRAWGNRGRRI